MDGTLEGGACGGSEGLDVVEGGETSAHSLGVVGFDELLLRGVVVLEGLGGGGYGIVIVVVSAAVVIFFLSLGFIGSGRWRLRENLKVSSWIGVMLLLLLLLLLLDDASSTSPKNGRSRCCRYWCWCKGAD